MSILATLPRGSILLAERQTTSAADDLLDSLESQLYGTLTEPQRQVYDAPERF